MFFKKFFVWLIGAVNINIYALSIEKGGFDIVTDSGNQNDFTINTSRSLNYSLLIY